MVVTAVDRERTKAIGYMVIGNCNLFESLLRLIEEHEW